MIAVPSPLGSVVVVLTTLVALQMQIVTECIAAGLDEPVLQGVQVDSYAGGDPANGAAAPGQAYAWILLDDAASPAQQATAQAVLDAHAPTPAKAPITNARAARAVRTTPQPKTSKPPCDKKTSKSTSPKASSKQPPTSTNSVSGRPSRSPSPTKTPQRKAG